MTTSEPTSESEERPVKRLYRSQQQKIVAGVCGGLAEYFQLDVAVVRIFWILFTLAGGAGIIGYLLFWMVVPTNPGVTPTNPTTPTGKGVGGVFLILLGVLLLAATSPVWGCSLLSLGMVSLALPGLVFAVGVGLLIGFLLTRDRSRPTTPPTSSDRQRLYRSRTYRVFSGVCGGLAQYFNLDPVIMRILWVLFAFGSFGLAVILYLVLMFIVPEEP